jgi:hypothetical protein
VPGARPSVDKATPPAANAPVHRRSHDFCVLVFMPLRIPLGNAHKNLLVGSLNSNPAHSWDSCAVNISRRIQPYRYLVLPGQVHRRGRSVTSGQAYFDGGVKFGAMSPSTAFRPAFLVHGAIFFSGAAIAPSIERDMLFPMLWRCHGRPRIGGYSIAVFPPSD